MREIIPKKHSPDVPDTTRSNKINHAIDGIWGSHVLLISERVYLTYHQGLISDHRLFWNKLSSKTEFGNIRTPSKVPSYHKLRIYHTYGQKKYISKLLHITREHNLLPILRKMEKLQK